MANRSTRSLALGALATGAMGAAQYVFPFPPNMIPVPEYSGPFVWALTFTLAFGALVRSWPWADQLRHSHGRNPMVLAVVGIIGALAFVTAWLVWGPGVAVTERASSYPTGKTITEPINQPLIRVTDVRPMTLGNGSPAVKVTLATDTTGVSADDLDVLMGDVWVETRFAAGSIAISASESRKTAEREPNRIVFGFHDNFPPPRSVDWLPALIFRLPKTGDRAVWGGRINRTTKIGFQEYVWWIENNNGKPVLHGGPIDGYAPKDSQARQRIDGFLNWDAPFISYNTPDSVAYFGNSLRFHARNLGDREVKLEEAFVVSAVTGAAVSLMVEMPDRGRRSNVPVAAINPIPPSATIDLVFEFTTKENDRGISEADFIRDWGRFEFVAKYSGSEFRQTYDEQFVAARFRNMRGPLTGRTQPRVTKKSEPKE